MKLEECDFAEPLSIERYAKQLEGMTFAEVLDLGISPEGVDRDYANKRYKGGLGTFIEERFFGYKANSTQDADFPEAGVELKASPIDIKKTGEYRAGERLVLTMIPLDRPIDLDFYTSHAWQKAQNILLIYYIRDKSIDGLEQEIKYVNLFTPSAEDLKIIEADYEKIASLVQEGRANELSESLTSYLGACTKGASEKTMWVNQYYPPHTPAKKRAFCFKQSYMNAVVGMFAQQKEESDSIVKDASILDEMSFEEYVLSLLDSYVGKTDKEICASFGLEYTENKAQWSTIAYKILGVRGEQAEEFVKANVSVRAVRIEENNTIRESLSLNTFKFKELVEEEWEDSPLRNYFEETRFLFVPFRKKDGELVLAQPRFWSMPVKDMDGPLRECWEKTKSVIAEGVKLDVQIKDNGEIRKIKNNLPSAKDGGGIAHVRPHAGRRAYRLEDGTEIGNIQKDGDELPDGRVMTKHSFWLNSYYVYEVVTLDEE